MRRRRNSGCNLRDDKKAKSTREVAPGGRKESGGKYEHFYGF
jgi:hypothetical protein